MVDFTATIDAEVGDTTHEVRVRNFQECVKLECSALWTGPLYVNRQDLMRALLALDVGSE